MTAQEGGIDRRANSDSKRNLSQTLALAVHSKNFICLEDVLLCLLPLLGLANKFHYFTSSNVSGKIKK